MNKNTLIFLILLFSFLYLCIHFGCKFNFLKISLFEYLCSFLYIILKIRFIYDINLLELANMSLIKNTIVK